MKCLVTGAAGFIGNSLVKRLVEEGYEVTGLIHKQKPENFVEKAKYINGDVTQLYSIRPLVKDIDFVFHCAAMVRDYGPKNIFYKVNFEGTKNLVQSCEKFGIKKFVFLSHINYTQDKKSGYYSETKALAEQYLLEKHKKNQFPVVIIRPGNVYGPGATTWILRPLKAIQKKRISLIDNGNGIFLHTYIDNLLDALIAALHEPKAIGERIDVTDGDNSTTWGEYLNCLAELSGKPQIKKNMSKRTALFIGKIMLFLNKVFRVEPWVTPMAVNVFTNQKEVSIEKAKSLLNYEPQVDFDEGMKQVENWLREKNLIS